MSGRPRPRTAIAWTIATSAALLALSGCSRPIWIASPPAEPLAGAQRLRAQDGATMVYVPAGTFLMGSTLEDSRWARKLCRDYSGQSSVATCPASSFTDERPAHEVQLRGFWIDRTEVTINQYKLCVEAGDCSSPEKAGSYTRDSYYDDPGYSDYPLVWVRWDQAVDYCAWAGARLPTESEWEYAARGPQSLAFPWGNEFDSSKLNYCDRDCPGVNDTSADDGYPDTAPVGSYPSGVSWCGALDLAGNVREWVSDWLGRYPADLQVDPAGPESGNSYITRGGCWFDRPDDTRSANRGANTVDYSRHKVGFRCASSNAP